MRRATGVLEHLDRPVPPADRRASLADIDRLSAWFGGYALTLGEVRRAARGLPRAATLTVVDVGGGAAAFAVRVVAWARRVGRRARVVVVERDPDALALARAAAGAHPEIHLVCADAGALPLRAGAAHVVGAALTLHHLEPEAAAACLREMAAVGRRVVVNDLLRTPLTLVLVWLATRLCARHPYARHDGPLSVRRAYAPYELRALAEKAGIPALEVRRYPLRGRLLAVTGP